MKLENGQRWRWTTLDKGVDYITEIINISGNILERKTIKVINNALSSNKFITSVINCPPNDDANKFLTTLTNTAGGWKLMSNQEGEQC